MMDCGHPEGDFLYFATDAEGCDVMVLRCTECGKKYTESAS